MELTIAKLRDVKPYGKNPRKNAAAVDAVAESIRQCSYIAPIIVDEDHVILAGHTRYKALKKLGYTECEIIVKEGLTEEQKRKYRILDNKTNEFADWDIQLLAEELDGLDFDGFDFGFDMGEEEPGADELDAFDEADEKIVVKISFANYADYARWERDVKDFVEEIGATMTVSKNG